MAAVRFGTLTTGMFGFSFLRAGAYLTLATAATGMWSGVIRFLAGDISCPPAMGKGNGMDRGGRQSGLTQAGKGRGEDWRTDQSQGKGTIEDEPKRNERNKISHTDRAR